MATTVQHSAALMQSSQLCRHSRTEMMLLNAYQFSRKGVGKNLLTNLCSQVSGDVLISSRHLALNTHGIRLSRGRNGHRTQQRRICCMASKDQPDSRASDLLEWLSAKGMGQQLGTLRRGEDGTLKCVTSRAVKAGEVVLTLPENLAITRVDVSRHKTVAPVASGRSELVALTLWVMYERSIGEESQWHPYLRSLPRTTLSPILWSAEELRSLLKGSPVVAEVQRRLAVLEREYADMSASFFDKDLASFPPSDFTYESFRETFCVVLSRAVYLPSADMLCLAPMIDCLRLDGVTSAFPDYSEDDEAVVLRTDRPLRALEQIPSFYGAGKPNSELLIQHGFVDPNNEGDLVEMELSLVPADRLLAAKKQILEQLGMAEKQVFPLFNDRFPTQLLTYQRLSRIQDPGQLAKIDFEKDVVVDQSNEYEVLMLLMADCRERMAAYEEDTDELTRMLKSKNLGVKERLAAELKLSEQGILLSSISAFRTRLAPIRGIPTKSGGLQDPNADILGIFDQVETAASASTKFLSNIFKKGS